MPTAISANPAIARRFALRGIAASLALFALLRLAWIEAHVLVPLTQAQAALAHRWFGQPALPIGIGLACSGADAVALCLGAVIAYPVPWRARLLGAAGGAALIVALNTIRIGTLGRAAASPAWFGALHLYVWPVLLTLAIAGYVFAWMRRADRGPAPRVAAGLPVPSRRFIVLTGAFVLVFLAISPLYLESTAVLALAEFVTRGGAVALGLAGIGARAAGNVLWTEGGGFAVTPECIATPLIPVYLAAVCAYAPTRRRLAFGLLATLPIFVALGVVRLLLVALPAAMASPLFWVHSFYQLLLAVLAVCAAAVWRHRATAGRRALAGLAIGIAGGLLLEPIAGWLVQIAGAAPLEDAQGAIAFLPAFQMAFYVALCVAAATGTGWTRLAAGFAALCLSSFATLIVLRLFAAHAGMTPHVRDVRAWAIAAPLLLAAAVMKDARHRR